MARAGRRQPRWWWVWPAAGALAIILAITLFWFQPQKLLYDRRVHERLPGATASAPAPDTTTATARPVVLAGGTFIPREHPTRGSARVLRLADGQVIVRFEGFATANGPVLVVWLSQNAAHGPDGAFDDHHVSLGSLKGNVGDQNYPVPAGVDVTEYTSVVVWCDRFHVSFGAADLVPQA